MNSRIVVVPWEQWQAERALANLSDDARAAVLARFAAPTALRKRPGPSKARQKARHRRNDALRALARREYPGHSASNAARLISRRVLRYAEKRLKADLRDNSRPADGIEAIVFYAAKDGAVSFDATQETIKFPSENSLALILLGHR